MLSGLRVRRWKPGSECGRHKELEPELTVGRIEEIEQKIGAGLIEEVIQVAQGELKVVDQIAESKASVLSLPLLSNGEAYQYRWEDLEDKAPEGQWQYFARDTHVPVDSTQTPK